MDQHTYSFPKVTPVDPDELREGIRAARRDFPVERADEPKRPRNAIRSLLRPAKG